MTKWHRGGQEPRNSGRQKQEQRETGARGGDEGGRGGVPISKWYMLWQGADSTTMWSVLKYSNALYPIVSGSVLLFLYSSSSTGEARTRQ